MGGIQSANIFEVKPDASEQPGYAEQTNAERAKVQLATMRQCGGRSSASPATAACRPARLPEAGVLIQR